MAETAAFQEVDTGEMQARGDHTRSVVLAPDLRIIYSDPRHLLDGIVVPRPTGRARLEATAKRMFDIAVASTALLVSLPVWLVVYAITYLSDDGPVLFAQERIGRGGRMFRCWKFRTMRVDADNVLRELLDSDRVLASQWKRDQKLVRDPRVTPLGRILRRFDLDEIPQFVNVVRGDMSLVGPRPVVLDEAPKFGDSLPTVLSVRPGLTGAWQVSGRNTMTYDERVAEEAQYARTRTFGGDLAICLRTPLVLIRRNGGR